MSAEPPRVFLVDDDPLQVLILGGILRTSGYRVEAFEHPEGLLLRLSASDRGCVVLDQEMPGLSGLEVQKALLDRGALLPLIFVSGRAGVPAAVEAMKRGALDFLSKPVDPEALCAAVESALRRDAAAATERGACEQARTRWAALSAREKEVCCLLAKGMLNKQIAAELGIAESTLHPQRIRALQKLGVSTVAELVYLMERRHHGSVV